MKSIWEVSCNTCGGTINTQRDAYRKETDVSGTVRHWHLPSCPTQGERNEATRLQLVSGLARSVC